MSGFMNNPLNELYTIEAKLRYGELPIYLKEGFLGYGFHDLNGEPIYTMGNTYGVSNDEITCQFISIGGRLKKHKCDFIKTYELAVWLKDMLQKRMLKKYPSIEITVRKVNSYDLNYRKKKAMQEALNNDKKIQALIDKENTKMHTKNI